VEAKKELQLALSLDPNHERAKLALAEIAAGR
jgi:Tfp pilus assembly protein PilF